MGLARFVVLGEGLFIHGQLAVGAGAAPDDFPDVLQFGGTAEAVGFLAQDHDELLGELVERDQLADAEVPLKTLL